MIAEKGNHKLIVQNEINELRSNIDANELATEKLNHRIKILESNYNKLNNEINNKNNISIKATVSVGILIFIVLSVINIVEVIK